MQRCNTLTLSAFIATTGLSLQAQSFFTSGHGDVGLAYEDGAFEPHWHLGGGAIVDGAELAGEAEYAPADLIASTSATRFSPSGLSVGLGVPDGTEIFVLGSSSYQPNLGLSVEELVLEDWVGDITLSLTNWTMPAGAQFALYTTNLSDTTVSDLVFSTFDSSETFANNSVTLTPGDHMHFQWALTGPGLYDFEFTWEGVHVVDGFQSASETFSVQAAVPEPAATAFLITAFVGGCVFFKRRKRA